MSGRLGEKGKASETRSEKVLETKSRNKLAEKTMHAMGLNIPLTHKQFGECTCVSSFAAEVVAQEFPEDEDPRRLKS